jgi:hypothetical protein
MYGGGSESIGKNLIRLNKYYVDFQYKIAVKNENISQYLTTRSQYPTSGI